MTSSLRRGALLMLLACLLFAVMGVFVKQLSATLPTEMVVFFRNAFGLLALVPLLAHRGAAHLATQHFGMHLVRALTGVAAMYCFFYALGHLPLADAILLNYTAPLFTPFIAALWLRESFPRTLWFTALIGFIGIVFILKPGAGLIEPAALIGLGAGLLSAVAMTGIRRLTRTESTTRIVFYFSVVATAVSLLPLAWRWQAPGLDLCLPIVLVGALATAAQLLLTRAYACAPAAQVGPFTYAIVVYAWLLDWLLWGETPDTATLLGAALVSLAGILTLRFAGNQAVAPVPDGTGDRPA
jgi:drug/metabolite transporter (DMT)-like permease